MKSTIADTLENTLVEPGQQLGSYRITAALGSGGMGEVWRATDSHLGREVALKLLPAGFADDPDRHARFEREARTLAALNHPGIATLYGLEHLEGHHALVMELLEGTTLADAMAHGPMPAAEVIRIAGLVAEALEAAHEHGIVHRDLKPANVMIRSDGAVKVLDFGLAKSWQSEAEHSSLSLSPTMTRHATVEGVILGTAAYMAPEQARGRAVDRRADIWAFGVVLWEMLTGRRLFDGETVSDVLAAVLTREIPLEALPGDTPRWLVRLVRRCLQRDPRQRLQWIGDARLELGEAEDDPAAEPASAPAASTMRRAAPWVLCAVALAAAGWLAATRQATPADPLRLEAAILPPAGHQLALDGGFALSPDGTQLAFVARDESGVSHLWVRPLERAMSRRLPGSEGARAPFWSPSGEAIGFFARGSLYTLDIASGHLERLSEALVSTGASWGPDDTILFSRNWSDGIQRIGATGGEVVPIDLPMGIDDGLKWPSFLPDGRHFVYVAEDYGSVDGSRELWVASVDGGDAKRLLEANSNAQITEAGTLLWWQNGNLRAQPLDLERLELTGRPEVVAAGVRFQAENGRGAFSVSRAGVLVVGSGDVVAGNQVTMIGRDGTGETAITDRGVFYEPRLSPDGRLVAVDSSDEANFGDIWVFDVERGAGTRLTTFPEDDTEPVWSPSGDEMAFCSNHGGDEPAVFVARLDGSQPPRELVRADGINLRPRDWTADGELLLYAGNDATIELWIYTIADGSLRPYLPATDSLDGGDVSPDGRYVVYTSREAGRAEVFVVSFPDPARRWRVTVDGGTMPMWGPGGDEILYLDQRSRIASVAVVETTEGSLSFGPPAPLFETGIRQSSGNRNFDSVDGRRFLINGLAQEDSAEPLTVMVGWERAGE